MKKFVIFLFAIITFTSCATLKDDVFVASDLPERVKPQLKDIELKLVEQSILHNDAEIQKIYFDLNTLLKIPSSDEKYLARINALMADYYILAGNKVQAKNFVEKSLKQNRLDEYAILVNTKCMKENEAIEYANAIFERFPSYFRVAVYLGHLYFNVQDYKAALVCFDASLPFLDKVYSELYGSQRTISYNKYLVGDDISESTIEILDKDKILLIDMTTITNENTDALNIITGNSKWKTSMLADRLKAAGWYRPDANLKEEYARRKDVAIFLWHLICRGESSRLSFYSNRYKNRKRSPIIDVPIGSEYFDASLAMIENDIMPLVNGRYFDGETTISGADFYKYLKKADERR